MKRYRLHLELTDVIVLIAAGVLLPVMLSTAAGIVALAIAKDAGGIVIGVLVISFTAAASGSALIAVLLAGRKARLARRQSDFIANVSHELRTPLSGIRLYAQTLQSGALAEDPARAAECLDTILRETEWLDAMLDRILTWRASSRDALPLNMVVAPVVPAVQGAIARFRRMVPADEMELSAAFGGRRRVRHDPDAVGALVLNLLTNAYKYTGRDKRIGVEVRDTADGVSIEVRDNGVGLSPFEAKRVFQPFYRVERGGRGRPGGVGLGLAIARHLADRHGGDIAVASEPGRGAVFTVRLPEARE